MKTAEAKPASSQSAKTAQPFFNKAGSSLFSNVMENGHSSFFSSPKNSFFKSNNGTIQTKLTIGRPNDKYEQEADHMADKVVQRLSENNIQTKPEKNNFFSVKKNDTAIQQKPVAPVTSITPLIQAKCTTCEQDEKLQKKEEGEEKDLLKDKLQKKPIFESNAEPPDDKKNIQRKCAECEKEEKLQKKPIFESNRQPSDDEKSIQRKCAECEKEDQKKLQTKAENNSPQTASPSIESSLNSSKGSGNPLPAATREQMESSFDTDFSDVRIHNDSFATQMSKDLNAQAFTHGNDIYFGLGKYDTKSHSGQHLLAHELTHTVQQEKSEVRRFEADEHMELGSEGSQGPHGEEKRVELADGYYILFKEMVAMAGDHFETIAQMRQFAANDGKGGGTREEIEYVRVVKIGGKKDQKDNYSTGAQEAAEKRYYDLALKNRSHFSNPTKADATKTVDDKGGDVVKEFRAEWFRIYSVSLPENSNAGYRFNHFQAITEAYIAGQAGKSIDSAQAAEAFSDHYLTDSFAAGHVVTPRADISSFWNAKVPMFNYNLKGYIAEKLAKKLSSFTDLFYHGILWKAGTLDVVTDKLDAKGKIQFGDVVSGALHDYYNKTGIIVRINGQVMRIYGDGYLNGVKDKDGKIIFKNEGRPFIADAVRLSLQDVEMAWAAGKKQEIPANVLASLLRDKLFESEKLLPVPLSDAELSDADKPINWEFDNVDKLLGDGKFQEALKVFATSKADEFEGVAKELENKDQQDAFISEIVKPLREKPVDVIKDVLIWTPDTGGGLFFSHNQDDNAMDYYAEAKKNDALNLLTTKQRSKIIRAIVSGFFNYVSGSEEETIIRLFNTAAPGERPVIYEQVEGHKWTGDWIEGWFTNDDDLWNALTKEELMKLRKLISEGAGTADSQIQNKAIQKKPADSVLPEPAPSSASPAFAKKLMRLNGAGTGMERNEHNEFPRFANADFDPGGGRDGDSETISHDFSPQQTSVFSQLPSTNTLIQKKKMEDVATGPETIPQRGPAPAAAMQTKFISENAGAPVPGQIRKNDFLTRLVEETCLTVDLALKGTPFSSDNCPYIKATFKKLENKSATEIEQLIFRYAPATTGAQNIEDVFRLVKVKIFDAAKDWALSGKDPAGLTKIFGNLAGTIEQVAGGVVAGISKLLFKAQPGGPHVTQSPKSVLQSLGKGKQMDSSTIGKMAPAFGNSFENVELHTDDNAAKLSQEMNARAFTVGNHIAFAAGQHRPGTLLGDALMAHELAHVEQQSAATADATTDTENDMLEKNADNRSLDVFQGTITGSEREQATNKTKTRKISTKLRLQRCTFSKAPDNLTTAKAKADWITQAIEKDDSLTGPEIVKLFKTAAAGEEFVEIQENLDMEKVISYLNDWDAVQIGALGPVLNGDKKLNEKRKAYIVTTFEDFGMPISEVFVNFVFTNMYPDDTKQVLTLLSEDHRIGPIIDPMESVKKIIAGKGIDLGAKEYDHSGGSFGRGLYKGFKDFMESSELAKGNKGSKLYGQRADLPPQYQEVFDKVQNALFEQGLTPGKIIAGTLDNLAFNLPSGLYGLVKNTALGLIDLGQGNMEQAGQELTGAVIVIITHIAVKGAAAITDKPPAGTVLGPEGPNQFVIKGFKGPIPPNIARLGSILALNPEAKAAGGLLISRIGAAGLIEVADAIKGDSKKAYFVFKNGLPAIEALFEAKGDLANATAALAKKPVALLEAPKPTEVPKPTDPPVPGKVNLTQAAIDFGKKSGPEAAKLAALEKSATELSKRGYNVDVHGEGVTGEAGELEASGKDLGDKTLLESKRLSVNTERSVQTAIEKGTKQVGNGGNILIDGTGAGVTREVFQQGFGAFQRLVLPKRVAGGLPGSTGTIIFIFGETGIVKITF